MAHTQGLHLDQLSYHAPQVSPERPLENMPPVSLTSLPLAYGGFPVFYDAMFRLDGLCPASHEGKRNWLADNAVTCAFAVSLADILVYSPVCADAAEHYDCGAA